MTNAFVQVGLVVVIGHLVYDVSWPQDWLALVVFTAVGVITFGALGIAFSHADPELRLGAGARERGLPAADLHLRASSTRATRCRRCSRRSAKVLPLKWVIDGLSGAIVTGEGLADNAGALGIVALWGAAGLFLAVRHFRWE